MITLDSKSNKSIYSLHIDNNSVSLYINGNRRASWTTSEVNASIRTSYMNIDVTDMLSAQKKMEGHVSSSAVDLFATLNRLFMEGVEK